MKRLVIVSVLIICNSIGYAQEKILLKNFTLIDAVGQNEERGKSLLIVGDTIHSIFDTGAPFSFNDVTEVDLAGKFLLPGLFDAHTHFFSNPSGRDRFELVLQELSLMLKNGVTGVRDMSGDARLLAYASRQAFLDEVSSPDIYYAVLMAGPRFFRDPRSVASTMGEETGKAPWMRSVDESTNLTLAIAEAKGTGASGIKLYSNLSSELSNNIIDEAHKQQISVWAHAAILPNVPSSLVNAGASSLSHGPMLALEQLLVPSETGGRPTILRELPEDSPKLEALVELMAANGTYFDPTLLAYKEVQPASAYDAGVLATRFAYKAGVPLIVGTDRGISIADFDHLPLIDEMEILVNEVGISPMDVIKAATKNSAELLGIEDLVGTIVPGKKANILVVDSNPLIDITHLKEVHKVYKNGVEVK